MKPEGELKEKMKEGGIPLVLGRVDSIDFDEYGVANWIIAKEAIADIRESNLLEAKKRLNLTDSTPLEEVQHKLSEQLIVFSFSFDAWLDSYGDSGPKEPISWISGGTSFQDEFHRSAWILSGCGVLQAAGLICEGFDIPADLS